MYVIPEEIPPSFTTLRLSYKYFVSAISSQIIFLSHKTHTRGQLRFNQTIPGIETLQTVHHQFAGPVQNRNKPSQDKNPQRLFTFNIQCSFVQLHLKLGFAIN
jgi:hypothetical protein